MVDKNGVEFTYANKDEYDFEGGEVDEPQSYRWSMKWLIQKLFGKKEPETVQSKESIYTKAEKKYGEDE